MGDNQEKIKALREALEADEAFAADFKRAIEERSAEVISLAAAKGITLTAGDFAPAIDGDDIDLAELEAVAGGYSWEEFYKDLGCWVHLGVATGV